MFQFRLESCTFTVFMLLAVLSTLLIGTRHASAAIGPVADLFIVNKNVFPDGFDRPAVLAGATLLEPTFPGPVITGTKGDTFMLNVIDNLTDPTMLRSTSIHWHGLFQRNTPWADGVVGVSQCPIAPGDSFVYTFKADQAGTFWYHSHYSIQYCDGLRGALVVYDPQDPHLPLYDVDDESTIITLADWYHGPALKLGRIPFSASILINGLGRAANETKTELAVIQVEQNKRYRFRLISMSCDPNFKFSIDGHNMTIIEVDGVNHEPLTVNLIQIFAGQRYSFILNAIQPIDNYFVRAEPAFSHTGFEGGINSAILRYLGAPLREPLTTPQDPAGVNTLVETSLHPLEDPGAPGGSSPADVAIHLNVTLNLARFVYEINGVTYIPPTLPVLLQVLSGAKAAQELLPTGSVYMLPRNKTVEISISGGGRGSPHPFHLHGHTFDVVRSAGSTTYNYINPVRRDVVSAGESTNDNVTIRFTTDNSGPWLLHCHIDWHLDMGLSVTFAENLEGVPRNGVPVEFCRSLMNSCPSYRILELASWDMLCPNFVVLDPLTEL